MSSLKNMDLRFLMENKRKNEVFFTVYLIKLMAKAGEMCNILPRAKARGKILFYPGFQTVNFEEISYPRIKAHGAKLLAYSGF